MLIASGNVAPLQRRQKTNTSQCALPSVIETAAFQKNSVRSGIRRAFRLRLKGGKAIAARAGEEERISMSTPPGMRVRPAPPPVDRDEQTPAVRARRPPLVQRLPGMTDEHLLKLQRAATRISLDPEHSRQGAAVAALPLIDAEIGRRATGLKGAPAAGAVRK
jgi:hypothetical protein